MQRPELRNTLVCPRDAPSPKGEEGRGVGGNGRWSQRDRWPVRQDPGGCGLEFAKGYHSVYNVKDLFAVWREGCRRTRVERRDQLGGGSGPGSR